MVGPWGSRGGGEPVGEVVLGEATAGRSGMTASKKILISEREEVFTGGRREGKRESRREGRNEGKREIEIPVSLGTSLYG